MLTVVIFNYFSGVQTHSASTAENQPYQREDQTSVQEHLSITYRHIQQPPKHKLKICNNITQYFVLQEKELRVGNTMKNLRKSCSIKHQERLLKNKSAECPYNQAAVE